MGFYKYLTEERSDSPELKMVMEDIAKDLIENKTDDIKPGTLLGLIQSGKTRAFLGVMAKCFDEDYDISIIFTKNSVALVEQTLKRLRSEFKKPIDAKKLYVWDIIKLQNLDQITGYILQHKLIFVVKKEIKNLEKLHDIFDKIEKLKEKNILIIDDEADQASVSFVSDKQSADGIDFAKIAKSISNFRLKQKGRNSYLQVTATPYSLYLQPEDSSLNGEESAPARPAFTKLLKPHPKYVGGKYYFEESLYPNSTAYYIFNQVPEQEIDYLNSKKQSGSYNKKALDNALKTENFKAIREAIINYLVAGAIRQIQEENNDDPWSETYHSAFVLHTAVTKVIHSQQKDLLECLIDQLGQLSEENLLIFVENSYRDFEASLRLLSNDYPTLDQVASKIKQTLDNNFVGITIVNSENQVAELLGDDGQLRLDNPFNIFIGGQTLDRGITIDHLIGFFYGRSPKTFQMDTVLQHSRMYGTRSPEDLAVTRFYTSARVYEAMRNMHHFDQDLRVNIEKSPDALVRFIAKEGNMIVPCGPNKVKASSLISFKGHSRMLPIGFQTKSNTEIRSAIKIIDETLAAATNEEGVINIDLLTLKQILELVRSTYTYEAKHNNLGLEWDTHVVIKAVELAMHHNNVDKIGVILRKNRDMARLKNGKASFADAPDDGNTDSPRLKEIASSKPALLMTKQNGHSYNGWRDAEFYWPVILMPQNMPNYVYSED